MKRFVLAFVLASVKTGLEYDVISEVKRIEGVKEAYITYGVWDAVIRVEVESLHELDKVVSLIRSIKGVENTTTLVGV
ncbi:MAG: Lrp/AsnC ligand binding domain-containing protein [Thermofilaceae archaeon]|nr:Lrp/AsnC ligand binding domain-containing protein [Thermofilaceae archaeon]MCX8180182.1 Lrp/AsnC ligand binding domain-containing protein [Thermofilaceae archaeon]MDW8004162.1 Lrp/AsnC ligand binding domain-containing protein [Thermofilaceae archaeon]